MAIFEEIKLSEPHMSGREADYIRDFVEANWRTRGDTHMQAFEKKLTDYVGVNHAVAVSSGTAALHLALLALGVGKGELVLCQSLTFIASVNPVTYAGATPVLIGSEPATWNLCPNALEDAIRHSLKTGKKPRAVIAVHLYGMPVLLDAVLEICHRYEIPLIEDAAEALGSTFREKRLGSFGTINILSFNRNKIITTDGGGAILTNHPAYAWQCRFLATQAKDMAPHYQHSQTGYNYRLSNLGVAMGLAQMEVIEERVQQRRAIFNLYKKQLERLPGISFHEEPFHCFSNRWLTAIVIDPKQSDNLTPEKLSRILMEANIESRPVMKPMHQQPLLRELPYFGDNTCDDLFRNALCLPSSSFLSEEAILYVCGVIKKHII